MKMKSNQSLSLAQLYMLINLNYFEYYMLLALIFFDRKINDFLYEIRSFARMIIFNQ